MVHHLTMEMTKYSIVVGSYILLCEVLGSGGFAKTSLRAACRCSTCCKLISPGLVMSSLLFPSTGNVMNLSQLHILNLLVMAAEKF